MSEETQSAYPSFPVIRRGSVESLSLYEITDYELELLERGSPAGLYLNFSIFLLSIGISLVVTLTTTQITDERLFATYTVLSAVGIVGGMLLLGLWLKTRKSVKSLCSKIKNRIKPFEGLERAISRLDQGEG